MAPLSCPLCCNETFSSHLSLKYHILGMIDNLLCPSCNERCEDLMDLADHLGRECANLQKSYGSQKASQENTTPAEVEVPNEPSVENPAMPKVKVEMEEDSTANDQKNDAVNKEQTSVQQKQVDQDEILDDPNMIYSCEICNMTFTSVQEHLAQYHEGEEVLLETEEQEETAENQNDDSPFPYNDRTDDDDTFEDEESTVEDSVDNASERAELGIGKTISEENVIDKEGMPYTRKVVKVETDWNKEKQSDNKETSPITTKYIVEDGKVRKITEEDAAQISDKSRIIEVHNCPNCNLQFPNISHFKKHNCSSGKKVQSKLSEKIEKKYQMHKIKEEFRYQCTFCLAIYTSLIGLNDHMKLHLVQDDTGMVQKKTITMTLHVCEICNTKFPTYKQLRLHSRMHEPVKAKQVDPPVSYNMMGQHNEENTDSGNTEREKFECPDCGKFYDKEYEEVHMKSHDGQEQYICLACNRKFDSKANLDLHTKAHSNTKKFACSYCKKSFNNYAALEEHVLKQCQKRDFECQYCGRRFGRPHEKVKHERIHTGEKPHVCEICGKAFRVGYCLTLHMRTHTGNRPYTCHNCGKRFKSHSVFNHHMKTHSNDRNYKCPYCPKAFKTAVQLAGHKNSHTKPFSCTECNRPFASLYAVRAHMETHKRENNLKFECWICGASYARSFALRDHMTEAHGQHAIAGKSQDEKALMELDVATDETQLENAESKSALKEQLKESHDLQIATEDEEYQETGTEAEICQVQVLGEASEEDGYDEVHLQEVESSEPMEENHMEVVIA